MIGEGHKAQCKQPGRQRDHKSRQTEWHAALTAQCASHPRLISLSWGEVRKSARKAAHCFTAIPASQFCDCDCEPSSVSRRPAASADQQAQQLQRKRTECLRSTTEGERGQPPKSLPLHFTSLAPTFSSTPPLCDRAAQGRCTPNALTCHTGFPVSSQLGSPTLSLAKMLLAVISERIASSCSLHDFLAALRALRAASLASASARLALSLCTTPEDAPAATPRPRGLSSSCSSTASTSIAPRRATTSDYD